MGFPSPDAMLLDQTTQAGCLCQRAVFLGKEWELLRGVLEAEAAHRHTHTLWPWIPHSTSPNEPIFSAVNHGKGLHVYGVSP